MKVAAILMPFLFLTIVSAEDALQNPDFELPASKLSPNSTAPFVPLNENNTIPGWTSQGTVQYVIAGSNLLLPQNQHAVLLGEDGKMNQTFTANGSLKQYLLTFTLAPGGVNCAANVSLVVSAPDSSSEFSVRQNYSKEPWQIYGQLLGSWGNGEPVNVVLGSQLTDTTDTQSNATCWPVVDALILKSIASVPTQSQANGNLLGNGGFEFGPAFLDNSGLGVLLDSEPSLVESALQEWSVMGTIRYIDSKHYFVPEGNAAIEIVSGDAAGIQTAKALTDGSSYDLEFMLGDANDNCTGNFTVGVQAGSSAQNVTVESKGTGSATKFSITFKAGSSPTPISFQSYGMKQSDDGVLCGPLIDAVVLRASSAYKFIPWNSFPVIVLLLVTLLEQMFDISP